MILNVKSTSNRRCTITGWKENICVRVQRNWDSTVLIICLYLQQEMSAMEESLGNLRKELEAVEQEESKLREQEVDIKHEVEKYETVLKENQQKVKHWQKEVCMSEN